MFTLSLRGTIYNWRQLFRLGRWGSSLTVYANLMGPPIPPLTRAEIFWRMCLQSCLKTSPLNPHKSYPKFWNPRTILENTPLCPPKNCIGRGEEGFPNCLGCEILMLYRFGTLGQLFKIPTFGSRNFQFPQL